VSFLSLYTRAAFTAPINPPGATPEVSLSQVWQALEQKVKYAERFVGGAITNTDVLSTDTNEHGQRVTTREVVFKEGGRRIKEVCTEIPMTKVEFAQPNGGLVCNIVSSGAEGELYMTYTFEYFYPGTQGEELAAEAEKTKKMAKVAVESTIKVIREMVKDGRIK